MAETALGPDTWEAVPAPVPPVEALALGKGPDEVLSLLPRIFNLCRASQVIAMKRAFGLPVQVAEFEAQRDEIMREHQTRFTVLLPAALGMAPDPDLCTIPPDRLFRVRGEFPKDAGAFMEALEFRDGIWPVLSAVAERFLPGEAVVSGVPFADPGRLFADKAVENSVAALHADHPVLRHIDGRWGRGPLWRLAGRAVDIEVCARGVVAGAGVEPAGYGAARAARGWFGVEAEVRGGLVTAFRRVTPTDHMLAPGGALAQSLASLPPAKGQLARLVVDVLDPCQPVELRRASGHA